MYDATDEQAEATFSTLLHLLKNMPDRMAKKVLAGLLEEASLLQVMLEEGGIEPPLGDDHERALSLYWDRVGEGRDWRAAELLRNLMRLEG